MKEPAKIPTGDTYSNDRHDAQDTQGNVCQSIGDGPSYTAVPGRAQHSNLTLGATGAAKLPSFREVNTTIRAHGHGFWTSHGLVYTRRYPWKRSKRSQGVLYRCELSLSSKLTGLSPSRTCAACGAREEPLGEPGSVRDLEINAACSHASAKLRTMPMVFSTSCGLLKMWVDRRTPIPEARGRKRPRFQNSSCSWAGVTPSTPNTLMPADIAGSDEVWLSLIHI